MESNNKNISVDIIENIINVTEITNKWLMWCESNTPTKAVFTPSIFQMRDAYSHMVRILGYGFQKNFLTDGTNDFTSLFQEEYSQNQLKEAFTHCARAFYDCADYILYIIKEEVEDNKDKNSQNFSTLHIKLIENDAYITKLRSSKSEDMLKSYENIKNWDLFLQLITSTYVLAGFDVSLMEIVSEVEAIIDNIEKEFDKDVILAHDPDFYKRKMELPEIKKLPDEYITYIENDGMLNEVLKNSQEWADSIKNEFEEKKKYAYDYNTRLKNMKSVMANSNKISKRKQRLKSVWGFISGIVSALITAFLKTLLPAKQPSVADGQAADTVSNVSTSTFDWGNLLMFIVIAAAVFLLGIGLSKLFGKKDK